MNENGEISADRSLVLLKILRTELTYKHCQEVRVLNDPSAEIILRVYVEHFNYCNEITLKTQPRARAFHPQGEMV
jgi:hypothetical protein